MMPAPFRRDNQSRHRWLHSYVEGTFTPSPFGSAIKLRVRVDGYGTFAKIWMATDPEPSSCSIGEAGGIAACRDVRQPPPNVEVPEVVGHWQSEAADASGVIIVALDNGQTVPAPDSSRDRGVLANSGPRTTATLMMAGHLPSGRLWFVEVNPDPNFSLPDGSGPCYGAPTVGAWDEGATIVIQAPTAGSGADSTSASAYRRHPR